MKNAFKLLVALVVLIPAVSLANVEVDKKASTFKWMADKKIGDGHYGMVPLKSAKIESQDGKVTGGEFVINLKDFTVDDLEGEWEQKFLNHIGGPDFFETGKYPTATLKINEVINGKAKGELTIKGKTNSIEVPFKKEGNAYKGTLRFDRTQFNIVYGSGNFFKELAGDRIIKDEVKIDFNVVLKN